MFGVDRAEVWVRVDADVELIALGIQKKFPGVASSGKKDKTGSYSYTFKIEQENINQIKVKDKIYCRKVGVDFSYPRGIRKTNLYPLDDEVEKLLVEEKIVQVVREITLEQEVDRKNFTYSLLEICIQEEIKGFYKYNNLINFFYKALIRKFNNPLMEQSQFNNYDQVTDRFYQTGFTFLGERGWKIRLYSKLHEHNKKHKEKEKSALLRLEHQLTTNRINNIFKTTKIVELPLEVLKEEISKKIGLLLFELLKDEISRSEIILEKHLKNFNSRDLKGLIKDLQEWILDEKIIGYIIQQNSSKSDRQKGRYRAMVKESLEESQTRASPRRDNFNNLERLELFINKFLLVKCEVKAKYTEHLTFRLLKT